MEKLLRGSHREQEPGAPPELLGANPTAPPRSGSLTWSLILADLLLAALAAYIVFLSPRPLKPVQTILCIVALALGAWLSCMALLLKPGEQQRDRTRNSVPQDGVDSAGRSA